MEKKQITEEMGLQKEWMERAKKIKSLEELTAFVSELRDGYSHDYGTICHAVAAAAIAAAWTVERGPQGGITGFQAGAIMWEIIRGWGVWNDGPLQIVQWGNLCYPQYDGKLPILISSGSLKQIQEKAKGRLAEIGQHYHPDVKARLELLAAGGKPDWLAVEND